MDPVLEVLRDARVLLSDRSHWTKGAPSRRADGTPSANPADLEAVCWCAEGALYVSAVRPGNSLPSLDLYQASRRAVDELVSDGQRLYTSEFNDTPETTHDDVLALFDRAIRAREEV